MASVKNLELKIQKQMDDFQQALLEANFQYQLIASFDREIAILQPKVTNNIGSGKYERLKALKNDVKILKMLYTENHRLILMHYEHIDDIKWETL